PGTLQHAGGGCHGGATHTEHLRERFLGQHKLVDVHAVASHQQPACATLDDRVETSAGGVLRDLADERLRVMQHAGVEGATTEELVLKARGPHTKDVAGHLT